MKLLEDAITSQLRGYQSALDALVARIDDEADIGIERHLLLEAIEIARCARRLVRGRTMKELHDAFGAPGDFGYDTPIGEALARLYRGQS